MQNKLLKWTQEVETVLKREVLWIQNRLLWTSETSDNTDDSLASFTGNLFQCLITLACGFFTGIYFAAIYNHDLLLFRGVWE